MNIEVELISKELINPSSPTPHNLRHYQLSFLDQLQPPVFVPFVLFYRKKSNINNLEICNTLKQSLPEVLTIFYPLAGRVQNNSHVNCNDEGFLFVEAKAKCELSIILQRGNPYDNKYFVPMEPDEAGDLAAFCQITMFTCGGLAISFAMNHKIGDALSQFMFLNTWAAIARGHTDIKTRPFGWANLFPPTMYDAGAIVLKEKIVTRVFVFDASTIEALKAKYSVNGLRPSHVEALAVFIWSRFMASTQCDEAKKNKHYLVVHAVNLRSRIEPPLPKLCFGNLVWLATAEPDMEAKDDECYGIVKRMKDSIRNLNADYVKKLQNSNEQMDLLKKIADDYDKKEVFTFTSLQNFPACEADFGWGKASRVGTIPWIFKNVVMFINTKEGQGVEAWINLREADMAKFESDNELLAHVSSSPPPNEIPLNAQSRL